MVTADRKVIFLLFFATIVLFTNLSLWGVTETSEARYAEVSWEMYRSGNYLHPKLLNIGHYHKPPVTYWITTIAYHIFGPSAFAARFFLQIAVLLQIFLVYKIGRSLFNNNKIAFYAAGIYFSFPAVIIGTRALTTDVYLTTIILGAILSWLKYRKSNHLAGLYCCYFLLGLGFLTKGPVVFIVPIVVIAAFNKLIPSSQNYKVIHHIFGALLLMLVALSWFIMLYLENTQFLNYFIWNHTVKRFTTNNFGREKPFWFYLVIVPVTAFPWFIMLIKPLIFNWKERFNTLHLLLLWVFVPLLFFSFSTSKLILYVLPIYAGIALGAAYLWENIIVYHKRWYLSFIIFAGTATIGLCAAPFIDQSLNFDFGIYVIIAIILMVLILSATYLKHRYNPKPLLIYLCIFFTSSLTVLATFFFHSNPSKVHDQRNVAAFIKDLPDITKVYLYDERLPSLAFHLNTGIISIADGDKSLDRETQFEKEGSWKKTLITPLDISVEMIDNSVIVVEEGDEISERMKSVLDNFSNRKLIDSWVVYYGYL